ncbi:hypothetical protein SDC9_208638 [bioreactor metagenome]|uniref:Uncharacterized protein n=1 Tax=bioreactor metagenome TaxID=1076179 RepID=A0A645JB51_9ZZZZ
MIHDQRHFITVEHAGFVEFRKFVDGHRCSDVVAEYEVNIGQNQLPGLHLVQTAMRGQYFLRKRHCHLSLSHKVGMFGLNY